MKKIFLIIAGVLFLFRLYGQQQKDYAYCNYQMDSLIAVYSVDTLANIDGFYSFGNAALNLNEKKELINKIKKLFEQKQYVNLYALGSQLMYSMYFGQWRENPVEIQQILMDIYLRYYFYPRMSHYSIVYKSHIRSKNNYSAKGKKQQQDTTNYEK